jgi:2'-5' RNA ligase
MKQGDHVGRVFVAVPLCHEVREGLVLFLNRALKGKPLPGRSPKPENWHLTLRFLGEINKSQYDCVLSTLKKESLGECFDLVFGGLGAFPRPSKAAVLWVGVNLGSQQLCRITESLERALNSAGMPPADKPFSPHLTLSRIRPPQRLDDLIQMAGVFGMQMNVREVILYRSQLTSSGAHYEPLERFLLQAFPC